jgi:hypothetical protein
MVALASVANHLGLWPHLTKIAMMNWRPSSEFHFDPKLRLPIHQPGSQAVQGRCLFTGNGKEIEISDTRLSTAVREFQIRSYSGSDRYDYFARATAELCTYSGNDGFRVGTATHHDSTRVEWCLKFTPNNDWDYLALHFDKKDGATAHFAFSVRGGHVSARDENWMQTKAAPADRIGFENGDFILETDRAGVFFGFPPESRVKIIVPKPKLSWDDLTPATAPVTALNLAAGALKMTVLPVKQAAVEASSVDAVLISAARLNDFCLYF